jgi:hypothetical protein
MKEMSKIESNSAELIGPDTPLRLEDAVRIAFPAGGITVAGMRKEIARGNLAVEKIAGKLFTTLNEIKRMRNKCRVQERDHNFTNDLRREEVRPLGSCETDQGSLAESLEYIVRKTRQKLRKSS